MTDDASDTVKELARRLFETMERLDPRDHRAWSELTDRERDFYVQCIGYLIDRTDLIARALSEAESKDD